MRVFSVTSSSQTAISLAVYRSYKNDEPKILLKLYFFRLFPLFFSHNIDRAYDVVVKFQILPILPLLSHFKLISTSTLPTLQHLSFQKRVIANTNIHCVKTTEYLWANMS